MQALHRLAVVVAALLVAALAMAGPAGAQYPPEGAIDCSTSTTTAGSSFTCAAGGFKASSQVSVTANGSTTGASAARSTSAAGQWTYETTTTADANGVATAVIQVPDNATGSTRVTFAGLDPDNGTRVLTNADAVTVTQPGAGEGEPAPAPDAPGDDGTTDGAADGDDLSATGTSATMPLLGLAVLVLLGGVGLLAVTRRRQRARVDA